MTQQAAVSLTLSASATAAGDSAGGNLVMTALAYMKERSQGFPNTKASAAVAGSSNSGDPSVFQPPLAAVLISPAPDLTKSAAFWRPKGDEIFKYDYITSWEVSDSKLPLGLSALSC